MNSTEKTRHYDELMHGIHRHIPKSSKVTDRNIKINTSPHYTDSRFDTEQTVFGERTDGLRYDYSDRLVQWDYDKAEEATDAANASGKVNQSASWYDVYLTHYFGKPTRVEHILAGVNRSNGYPYAVFGYRFLEQKS